MIDKKNINETALNLIYEVDYDIGKEADPTLYAEDTYLIDAVSKIITDFLIKHGVEIKD